MSELKKVELEDKQVAFVMQKNSDSSVGVYIPSVMSEIDMGNKVWEKKYTLNNKMIASNNIKIKFEPITLTNTFKIDPKNISNVSAPDLGLGEKVWVSFIDNDLKKCVYTDEAVDETQRSTEAYSISVMARKSVKDKESKYTFDIDSNKKKIQLHTTKENGEKDELDFTLNGKDGNINISTSKGKIDVKGDTVNVLRNLCINGVNVLETLEALRDEVYGTVNEVVDDINSVINKFNTLSNTVSGVSSSIYNLEQRVKMLERNSKSVPSLDEEYILNEDNTYRETINSKLIDHKVKKGIIGTNEYIDR